MDVKVLNQLVETIEEVWFLVGRQEKSKEYIKNFDKYIEEIDYDYMNHMNSSFKPFQFEDTRDAEKFIKYIKEDKERIVRAIFLNIYMNDINKVYKKNYPRQRSWIEQKDERIIFSIGSEYLKDKLITILTVTKRIIKEEELRLLIRHTKNDITKKLPVEIINMITDFI